MYTLIPFGFGWGWLLFNLERWHQQLQYFAIGQSVLLCIPNLTTVRESVFFLPESRLSYHSVCSPATYQPQRVRFLCVVNVFGGLFLCCFGTEPCNRTSPVIIENNTLQGEARHLRFASRSGSPCLGLFTR